MTSKLTDEQAAEQFIWLTNSAGAQLQELTGGAPQAPVFDKTAVDYLNQIADTASALADHHSDEAKEAEKQAKEQEKAEAEKEEAEPEPEKKPEPVKKAEPKHEHKS